MSRQQDTGQGTPGGASGPARIKVLLLVLAVAVLAGLALAGIAAVTSGPLLPEGYISFGEPGEIPGLGGPARG